MCTLLTQNICLICHTQLLQLGGNQIGDAGLAAFAKAVESEALPQLESLYLYGNRIGDDGISAFADALSKGALDKLTVCWRPIALPPCLETLHTHSPLS